jgi:nicotinate-nucleotide adenylyltransferase
MHNGHLEVIRAVTQRFSLDRLLLIPAHRPPHKQRNEISNSYHRYAMAVLATLDENRVRVSSIELEAPERPFTVETIAELRKIYGDEASLYFIMGADSYEDLASWREPERLVSSTNIIVITRPGYEIDSASLPAWATGNTVDLRGRGAQDLADLEYGRTCCRIYLADFVNKDVSSTDIRRRVREGREFRHLVPPRVGDYIEEYELYR